MSDVCRHCHRYTHELNSEPPPHYSNAQVLRAYNGVARAEVERRLAGQVGLATGMSFLDLFDVVLPLFDLSYDEAHYQGPVGRALALRLVQHLAAHV